MPKEKCSCRYLKNRWVSGNNDYSTDGVVVTVKFAQRKENVKRNFNLNNTKEQLHILMAKKGRKNSTPQQLLLTQVKPKSSVNTFSADLLSRLSLFFT
jgi:hypothetical protein